MSKKLRHTILRVVTAAQSVGFFEGMIPDIEALGYDVAVTASPGPDLDRLAAAGVPCLPVAMQRHISPLRDIVSLCRLIRLIRRERPIMVHSMTPKAGLLAMMAAALCRVPVRVHTFTGLVFPTARGITQRILIITDRLTCRCATHIVPEGQGVLDDLRSFRITAKPMHVLGHGNVRGIDLDHYSRSPQVLALAAPLRRPDAFTFIFIGRLVGDKGINELVRAFTKLHTLLPHTRLILVGPEERTLDPLQPDTICAINSCPAIEAVGHQADVRPWLAAADALAFPSYREGFPNVVIEAGAMSLPAIVTDINGSREIITHGSNGLIIPPRSADALFTAMHTLATDADLTASLAANARPMIASRFDRRYVTRCLIDYYRSILPGEH